MASRVGAVMRAGRREDANQGPVKKREDGRKLTDTEAEREGVRNAPRMSERSIDELTEMNAPRAMAAGPGRLGEAMRPQSILPPVRSREEYDARVAENEKWAMAPETQAALLSFAFSIMQPVGGSGGVGDFVGALGRAGASGLAAASDVRDAQTMEEEAARKAELEERRVRVDEAQIGLSERQLTASEKRLDSEEKRLARQLGLDERKITLEERKMLQELKTSNKQKIIVSSDSPLNEQFNLGIPEGEDATVEVVKDENGNIANASIEGGFGGEGGGLSGKAKELEDLLNQRDEAIAAGDEERAQYYQNAALQVSQEFSLASGETLNKPLPGAKTPSVKLPPTSEIPGAVPSIPGDPSSPPAAIPVPPSSSGMRIEAIPGGKKDMERQAAEAAAEAKRGDAMQKGVLVGASVDTVNDILEKSIAPNWLITGGIGSIAALLPHPSDAATVAGAIKNIESNAGFEQLQAMREASPTGGALGPVSDTENKLLQSTLASLNQFRRKEVLQKDLLTVKFIFDPIVQERVANLNQAVSDKRITTEEAVNNYVRMLDEYIYPPHLNAPPPLDWTVPPEYISDEDKQLWQYMDPADKLLFMNEADRQRAMGQ